MKKSFVITFLVFVCIKLSFADNYPRNHDINIIHYTFKLILSDSTNDVTGVTDITVRFLKNKVTGFNLNLIGKTRSSNTGMTVSSVTENGQKAQFEQNPQLLNIKLNSPSQKGTEKIFTIDYSGVPADGLIISKNKFGQRTFFGDNWPDRARFWLPTIDHPYDKATCDFIVVAPERYQVIANGLLYEETDLPYGMRLTHWKETIPISTELMVIGVARFAVQYVADINCVPVETWVYPQDRVKGFHDFAIAANIIKYFSSLIAPFPFHKLANVESKTIYGGMENAGNIFYAENSITGSGKNTTTVAHEIAHQWFGDAVTEEDWNHIWLSEGFATFFQNLFTEHHFGIDSLYSVLKYDKSLILNYEKYNPGAAVVDTSITNLNLLLNPNSYQKGAWVLRMLRHLLGEKDFWKGIRDYYSEYKYKNALTKDFERVMETDSRKDLKWFFDQWIYRPGFPFVNWTWHYNERVRKLTLTFYQNNKNDIIFRLPLDVEIKLGGRHGSLIKHLQLDKRANKFEISLNGKPQEVILDPDHFVLMESTFKKD